MPPEALVRKGAVIMFYTVPNYLGISKLHGALAHLLIEPNIQILV